MVQLWRSYEFLADVGMMRPIGTAMQQGMPQGGPTTPQNIQFSNMANHNNSGSRPVTQNNSMNASNSSIDLNNLDFLDGFDTTGDFGFDSTGSNILDDVLGTANRWSHFWCCCCCCGHLIYSVLNHTFWNSNGLEENQRMRIFELPIRSRAGITHKSN